MNGYPSLCGCALLAPTLRASTPCASVTAYNEVPGDGHEAGHRVALARRAAYIYIYIYI